MAIRKVVNKQLMQGYTGTQLRDDIATLASLRSVITYADGTRDVDYEDDITRLIVGKACTAVLGAVDTSLQRLFTTIKSLLPDRVVKAKTRYRWDAQKNENVAYEEPIEELQYKMGPLKKVPRITEKAVSYAVCNEGNFDTPQLQQVRDILRATMVFPPSAWGEKKDGIGSKMIDAVNEHFGGALIQVKNRFIHDHYPNFSELDGYELPDDLARFVERDYKQTLWGRDSFYRDIQLLVRIDDAEFPNGQDMTHTFLELQLASSKMYAGKTNKNAQGGSGHDMYKNVRAVSEYCEYLWWRKKHGRIALPNAASYYDVAGMNIAAFAKQAEDMASLYRSKDVVSMSEVLANAIDDSKWYESLTAKAKG